MNKIQKIRIIEHEVHKNINFKFEADPIGQPGSPRVGRGKTKFLALTDLLRYNEKFNINVIDETGELL